MSCSKCGSVNTSCGCKDTAYTTPKVYTCPPDTSCPQPVRCSEFMDAACIFLNDGIADAGIQPHSSLESIIQQLILLVTNPGCVDAPGGVPGGGTVTFIDAIWPGNAITIAGGPISNSGTFVFNGNGNSSQYIDGQGNLQTFPSIPAPIEFQTNGTPNSVQDLLNLVAGTGVTLTESGGSVTIDVDAVTYSVQNGLSEQPASSGVFELGAPTVAGAPLLHDTYIEAAGYGFDIHAASLIYYQGNRIEVESGSAGALVLSTGGASDNSLEVDGTEVAIQSIGGANTTKIFLDPLKIRIQTPLFNTKNDGDVLTLIDKNTGEVEYMPPASILLQTNGVDNPDQTYLNLIQGNGITLTNVAGDVTIDGPTFQTNGTDNGVQTLLNLVAGTGITLTESSGSVTIEAGTPFNLTIQDEGANVYTNPTIINFVGAGVTATNPSGSQVLVTIPGGGGGGSVDANNGLILNTGDFPTPTVQLGGPSTAPSPLIRNTYITTATPGSEFDFDVSGARVTKPILNVSNTDQGPAVKGNSVGGYAIYGVTASGFSGYFEADSSLIGVYSVNKTGNLSAEFESVSSINNTVIPVVRVMRTVNISNPGINGANGIGAAVDFFLEDNNNIAAQAGALSYEFTSAATGAVVSQFAITTANSSTISRKLEITGAGQLILNNYTTATSFDPESGPSVGVLNVDNTGKVFVGTGGGGSALAVEVDGTPLSSSTLLNFIPSADIAVTDAGGGSVQFSLVNPYTVNNGLSSQITPTVDTNNFQLGGPLSAPAPLIHDTYIEGLDKSLNLTFDGLTTTNGFNISSNNPNATGVNTQRLSTIILNGANSVPGVTTSALYVENNRTGIGYTSIAGFFKGSTGVQGEGPVVGVYGISTTTGVSGEGNTIGVRGYSSLGAGVDGAGFTHGGLFTVATGPSAAAGVYGAAENASFGAVAGVSQNGVAGYFRANSTGISDSISVLRIVRDSTGTTSAGFAARIDFGLKVGSSVSSANGLASYIETKLINATPGSEAFQLEMYTAAPSANNVKFTILGGGTSGPGGAWSLTPGQIKFNSYAAGAIYKSANDLSTNSGFNLGIDANGNIWATDFSTTTGPVSGVSSISIGTLANGASATVSNPSGPAAAINITGQNAYTQIAADTGTASADVYNSQFSVVGADGITTSVTNGTMPTSDVITVTGPDKYLNFVTKNISGTTIATYTPTIWNETLNIQAGAGITITNGGVANTIVISAGAGSGTVSNVTGNNANGFTVGVTNGTTTPEITVGTSITGVLVGNGTSVSAVTGTGVMVFSGTGYTFQALPTVNDGALNVAMGTNAPSGTAVQWGTNTGFTANIATNIQYDLRVGPALVNLATYMSQVLPPNPTPGAGVLATRPVYIRKSAIDNYTDATPVTTFSPGTTGFTVTSGYSTATALGINENVVLGGVLNVSSGGTGLSTTPGNGQILIGNGTGYTLANISGGDGINIINTAGGIQIEATGLTGPNPLNGIHIHAADSSIRLGSGTTGDVITPLIEVTNIRMNAQVYKLSNSNTGYINQVGFQIDDATGQKLGYLGSSTNTTADGPNAPAFGFVFHGNGGTALTAYNGVYINNTSTSAQSVSTGFSTLTRQVITRDGVTAANNKLTQIGSWGGANDITFYEAIPSAQTIQVGPTGGNNTQILVNDSITRFVFNKGIIYGTNNYGTATPVGLNAGTTARYLLGTASDGKFYEVPGISIGRIIVGATNYTPTTIATAAAPNGLTIQGAGTVTVGLSGSILTITGGTSAFPYWSTLAFSVLSGSTGTINSSNSGTSTIIPDTNGPNQLNIQAGNNIDIATADGATNRFIISANVTPVNSWGPITLGGNSTVVSPSVPGLVLTPDQVNDGLNINAGTGIGITVASNTDTFTINNTGVLSLALGTVDAFSLTGTASAPILNIPYRWRLIAASNSGAVIGAGTSSLQPTIAADALTFNGGPGITLTTDVLSKTLTISSAAASVNAWYNIAVANGSAAGGASSLTPNLIQDTLTFAGGTGISVSTNPGAFTDRVVITNTGVTQIIAGNNITITSTGASGTGAVTINSSASLPATNGVWIDTGVTPNEYRLGSNSDGASTFDSLRYINAQGNFLQIKGTPATGDANAILKLRSDAAGRGLRVENTVASSNGAIYALATVDASADTVTSPIGTIFSQANGKGHAVVGIAGTTIDSIAAVFGRGFHGSKGFTQTTNGIGVIGESLDTTIGTGVLGKAKGSIVAGETTYAGWFVINPTNNSDTVEILRVERNNQSGAGSTSGTFGGSIGYYLEAAAGTTTRAGQVSYTWGKTQVGDSRFKVSVVKASSPATAETVRLEVRETGQLFLSRYFGINRVYPAATLPANQDKGPFVPESGTSDVPSGANYDTTVYDYLIPGAKAYPTATDEEGRMDTLRNTQGPYNPAITVSAGGAPFTGSSPTIRNANFTRLNNIVQGTVRIQFASIPAIATGSFDINLPVWPDAAFALADDIMGTVSSRLNVSGNTPTYGRFDIMGVTAVTGGNNKMRLTIGVGAAQSLAGGLTNEVTIQFMYTLY